MRVRILLDVDGVINAVDRHPDPEVWDDWVEAHVAGVRVHYSPTVVAFLCRMAETDGVEIQWLTTWEAMANEHLCPALGLPECVVAGKPPFREKDRWWKFVIAERLWDRDGIPFVWADDDLGFSDDGAAEWLQSLGGRALGIRPATERGLTRRLLDEIETFVADRLMEAA